MPRRGVSEPVQVYLTPAERTRLERLAGLLDATKSDVIRRGIEALERALTDPASHPALQIIGLAGAAAGVSDRDAGYSVAGEHDRFLADAEVASWARRRGRKRRRAR